MEAAVGSDLKADILEMAQKQVDGIFAVLAAEPEKIKTEIEAIFSVKPKDLIAENVKEEIEKNERFEVVISTELNVNRIKKMLVSLKPNLIL